MTTRRRFGNVRKRESGRYQVRFRGPDGQLKSASQTFARKSEAERFLSLLEAQMTRGDWVDPSLGAVTVADYAERWISQRPNLRPRTVDLYRWLLRKHITPHIGRYPIGKLTTPTVRKWRADLLTAGVSESMAAKAYRLLRAVLMTALREDELIRTNPCRIPGADQEKPAERPVLTIAQVFQLAEEMPERFRALVLLATFACLRWGEAAALQRRDIDLSNNIVHVRRALVEVSGTIDLGPPKSRAGIRSVALPMAIVPAVTDHLSTFVDGDPESFVFLGPKGGYLRRGNFRSLVGWEHATKEIGVTGLHFHDLRHTGNTLAAKTGASLRDLMVRMGHDSPRAALIYQHASKEAEDAIAAAIDQTITDARTKSAGPGDLRGNGEGPGTFDHPR